MHNGWHDCIDHGSDTDALWVLYLTCPVLQERVAAAGGTVLNNSGLRVMGILQCTRAIGDKDLQSYGVIPTPDVLSLPRTGPEEFLVLATDGLWDVMSNEVSWPSKGM